MKIKNKMSNSARYVFLGGIMKKSGNYLPLTNREKSMINWFFKFITMILICVLMWIIPFKAIQGHISDFKSLEVKVSAPELKSSPRATQQEILTTQNESRIVTQTIREVSAYNAGDPNQCWGDPCQSANGENICLALERGFKRCAANFVPFGTELLIESVDKSWSYQCLVVDRMNKRYPNRVDIAMRLDEKQRAINFGVQKLSVSVIAKK